MNLTNLNKWARTCGLATTLIFVAGSIGTMTAADIPTGKGGAKLLMKPAAPVAVAAASAMPCAKCVDTYSKVKDLSARGANKPTILGAQHGCPGCSTKIATVGVGKAKQNVGLHTCASGDMQNSNCCARN